MQTNVFFQSFAELTVEAMVANTAEIVEQIQTVAAVVTEDVFAVIDF